ncbi:MAG: hypothetical protein AAF561_14570 [Planctomycetota bacterium]
MTHAPLPASVVVAQVGEVAPPDAMLEALAAQTSLFDDVQGVSGVAPPQRWTRKGQLQNEPVDDHLSTMLALARDIGADYLIIFGGTIDASDRKTPLQALDLTIIGAFVVPSNELFAESKSTAIVLDARSGRPVATATSSDQDHRRVASFVVHGERESQMRDLRDDTIEELTMRVIDRFERLRDEASVQ